jgi:hypothetical protein
MQSVINTLLFVATSILLEERYIAV